MKKRLLCMILAVIMLVSLAPALSLGGFADWEAPVYYSVDLTADVEASLITSHCANDSAMISATTVEAYMYGAVTDADKKIVYDTVVADSGNVPAYPQSWDSIGYVVGDKDLATIYYHVSCGLPVIVCKSGDTGREYAIVTGYTGSKSALEKSGFKVINPSTSEANRRTTLSAWDSAGTLQSTMLRNDGARITALSGIRFAINHPAAVSQKLFGGLNGSGFIPQGCIVSNNNITEVAAGFYNIKTASSNSSPFAKKAPNSKFFRVYEFNSNIGFNGMSSGDYIYFITVKDSSGATATYTQYFSIFDSYPAAIPTVTPSFSFTYKPNGGTGSEFSATYALGNSFTLPTSGFTKENSRITGWTVQRKCDSKFLAGNTWYTQTELTNKKLSPTVFEAGSTITTDASWLANYGTGDGMYFIAQWGPIFDDVAASAWYHDSVYWAYNKGITIGSGNNKFSPSQGCSRAEVVTFLYRAAGEPSVADVTLPFTDVSASAWYYDAVRWAYKNNITLGTDATTFSPHATCTRGQIVTFLYRAAGEPAVSGQNTYTDVVDTAYYRDPVIWAKDKNITNGTNSANTTFSPQNVCSRCEVVTFLHRQYK